MPLDGTTKGQITTKDRHAQGGTDAIPRSLDYFGWPDGPGLLLLDGDDIDGLQAVLCELYPPFAEVALLGRPSASASVIDPATGKALKTGEHGYVVIDDPSHSTACLDALMRLAWCRGSGKAAGRLKLSKSGDVLVRGPIDACVGSPERLSYEGAAVIGDGLTTLPRDRAVIGGKGMLCANDLLEFADRDAPLERFANASTPQRTTRSSARRRAAVQAAYRGEHIRQAVARGVPREKAEETYDRVAAAGTCEIGQQDIRAADAGACPVLAGRQELHRGGHPAGPDGVSPQECCDPVEGTSYQSRNCAIIYTNGPRIEIYSRAHGDAFAYVAPLDDGPPFDDLTPDELLAQVLAEHATSPVGSRPRTEEEAANTAGSGATKAGAAPGRPATSTDGVTVYDFYAYMPKHLYIFAPTGEMWPAASVNARLPRIPLLKKNGTPVRDKDGKPKYTTPSCVARQAPAGRADDMGARRAAGDRRPAGLRRRLDRARGRGDVQPVPAAASRSRVMPPMRRTLGRTGAADLPG